MSDGRDGRGGRRDDEEEGESPNARDKFDWATASGLEVEPPGDEPADEGKALSGGNGHARRWDY